MIRAEHYKGAASENVAAAWFLSQGRQVYWPAIHQQPVDMVVDINGKLLRVQVKTATWVKSGNNRYLQCRTRLTNKYQGAKPAELYDILFIVYENSLWHIPANIVNSSNLSLEGKDNEWEQFRVQ